MGNINFKVVGNGQLYIEKNKSYAGLAMPGMDSGNINFNTGDTLGIIVEPYLGYSLISLCDVPQTDCETALSYYYTITDGSSVPPVMIATFGVSTPPPVVTPKLGIIVIAGATSMLVGNAVELLSGCKDTTGAVMTCPLLTWSSANPSIATATGRFITGISAGTTTVVARDTVTGVTSNICTVTVTGVTPPVVPPVVTGAPKASIFNYCWGLTVPSSCAQPPVLPNMKTGDVVTIKIDVTNLGYAGKVRAVFKINGSQISSQDNASLGVGALWSPVTTYTMPSSSVTFTAEAYSWDGSTWTMTDTRSSTIPVTAAPPVCSNISIDPVGGALLDPSSSDPTKSKVTLTATVLPVGVSFPVTFVDSTGTSLGACNTTVGTGKCSIVFDSTTKVAGTYSVTAIAGARGTPSSCTSSPISIVVGVVVSQYTLTVDVRDSVTGAAVSGAAVLVASADIGDSTTKITDVSGNASFTVTMGTVSITISKAGYNTYTTAEYVYYSKTVTYSFVMTPVVPTTGSVQFVSVPSGAAIYLDGGNTGQVTPKTIDGIKAGIHNFTFKFSGYNDSSGSVNVLSGSTVSAYLSMTILTPTTGALNITSHPVMGAEIFIDGVDMSRTTSGSALITSIPPGTHSFKLVLAGYKDTTGTFTVTAGITTFIDAPMEQLVTIGNVEISSTPSGAMVYIDGVYTNKLTPAAVAGLGAGSHTYKLTLAGYSDSNGTFTIVAGNVTPLDVVMTLLPVTTGTLQITSTPPNAIVLIDGRDSGKVTPAIVDGLTEGSHTYLLKLAGYKDYGAIIDIVAGGTKVVSVPLEQIIVTPSPVSSGIGAGTLALVAAGFIGVVMISSKKHEKQEGGK